MKVLVTYFSQTGNTKKVAEAIYGCISANKEIKPLAEVSTLRGFDLAFVGFPIHGGQAAGEAQQFLQKHSNGNSIALFITHASPEDYPALEECMKNCRETATGANVLGTFECQGELSEVIADFMAKSGDPELVEAARQRATTVGKPDGTRLERARRWASKMLSEYRHETT